MISRIENQGIKFTLQTTLETKTEVRAINNLKIRKICCSSLVSELYDLFILLSQ